MKKLWLSVIVVVSGAIVVFVIISGSSNNGRTVEMTPAEKVTPDSVSNGEELDPTFSRPEERGEDLSLLETSEVVTRLVESQDMIERRKAAKVLGDRSIAGSLKLSAQEKEALAKVVEGYLRQAKASTAEERVEARQQVERLWHVAAPTLVENLNNKDASIAEMVVKSLILMRNESIVEALVEKARSAQDEYTKALAVFALKMMQEQRKSLIPGRECLGEEKSEVLYERLIAPALEQLGE